MENPSEKTEIGRLVGWLSEQGKVKGVKLRDTPHGTIYKLFDSRLFYRISSIPELSLEEARFIHDVNEAYLAELKDFEETLNSSEARAVLDEVVGKVSAKSLLDLDSDQRDYLLDLLAKNLSGLGPLDFFLEDESLEEIAIVPSKNYSSVHVYSSNLGWLKTNISITSKDYSLELANKMSRVLGRRLTLNGPRLNSSLPNGARMHAAIEPVSLDGPTITVRKFKPAPLTPLDLVKSKTLSIELLAYLWLVFQGQANTVVAGNTGSGKTTTLNALFSFIPLEERIVLVEETPEVSIPHEHKVRLVASEELGIGMNDLVADTLRMRPDRIIVGEVRTPIELKALLNTTLSGQGKGSFATYHALSAEEALTRMKAQGALEQDLESLDLILVQRRWTRMSFKDRTRREVRRLTHAVEVVSTPKGLRLNPVFEFDYKKDSLKKSTNKSYLLEEFAKASGLSKRDVSRELKAREAFLRKLQSRPILFQEFFEKVNGFASKKP